MGLSFGVMWSWHGRQLVEADECRRLAATTEDPRGHDIVRDSIHPGPESAASVKRCEAPPERDVDVLHQIAPPIRLRFVRAGKTVDRRAILGGGALV
jgi:hypothetical protein